MFELNLIISALSNSAPIMATNNTIDIFLWYFFLVLLIIGGIIVGALLIVFSKKPDDWEHVPMTDEFFPGGRLNYFADSIKSATPDYSDYSPLKTHIEMLFFEKVRATRGLSPEEIFEMRSKDPNRLRDIIKDKDITDWIFNFKQKEKKKGFFDFFRSDKNEKRQEFLSEMNSILDKMEVWGE